MKHQRMAMWYAEIWSPTPPRWSRPNPQNLRWSRSNPQNLGLWCDHAKVGGRGLRMQVK